MNKLLLNIFIFAVCAGMLLFYVNFIISTFVNTRITYPTLKDDSITINFSDFDNELGTKDGRYIVPNYVHFLRFDLEIFSFMDAVCLLAAFKNQKPDKIFIHHNNVLPKGKYWDITMAVKGVKEVVVLKNIELPYEIFGKKLNIDWRRYHGSDVSRIKILMKYGGIFLDNDSYIVRSLNDFRRYEMTLGWMQDNGLANQVIIANKNARFLKKWLESYKEYNSTEWYYNAGIKPTNDILKKQPQLIHRERYLLANHEITQHIYLQNWKEWKLHYAIHLLYNHQYILSKNLSSQATYPVKFNETNIKHYPVTIKDMIYDVYPIPDKEDKKYISM